MICKPCRDHNHEKCPAKLVTANEKPTGLGPESNAVQRSGLCACQHKVRLMSPITLEEAEGKIRAGLKQDCACGGRIVTGPEEPEGEAANFVALWFEDHSYEDLSKHGLLVTAKTQAMRAAAK